MESMAMARLFTTALKARQLFQEPATHQLFTTFADIDDRAAKRLLSDAVYASQPRYQLAAALAQVHSAYEKHRTRAENRASGVVDRIRAWIRKDKVLEASYRVALTALFIAKLNQMLGEQTLAAQWCQRAWCDFRVWLRHAWGRARYNDFPWEAPTGVILPPKGHQWLFEEAEAFEEAYVAVAGSPPPMRVDLEIAAAERLSLNRQLRPGSPTN
jgi:hypothetical protein